MNANITLNDFYKKEIGFVNLDNPIELFRALLHIRKNFELTDFENSGVYEQQEDLYKDLIITVDYIQDYQYTYKPSDYFSPSECIVTKNEIDVQSVILCTNKQEINLTQKQLKICGLFDTINLESY